MPDLEAFTTTFEQLKGLLLSYAPPLVVETDTADTYLLNAPPSEAYPRGLFFGAARVAKRYLSFHLMPVYVFPDLLDGLPAALRKRRQGKSCFNFTKLDDMQRNELERLTAAGFERYRREGLL